MLVELSVVEQKHRAVLAVIGDGREVTDVARQFGSRVRPFRLVDDLEENREGRRVGPEHLSRSRVGVRQRHELGWRQLKPPRPQRMAGSRTTASAVALCQLPCDTFVP